MVGRRQRSAVRLAVEQLDLRGWLLELAELAPQGAALEVRRIAGGGERGRFGGFTQVAQVAPDAGGSLDERAQLESTSATGALLVVLDDDVWFVAD